MRAAAVAQLVLLGALNVLALALARSRAQPTQPRLLLRLSAGGWALALGAQSVLLVQAGQAEGQAHSALAALLCCLLLALHWRSRQHSALLAALSGAAWGLQLWAAAAAALHRPALQPWALTPEYVAAAACGVSTTALAAAAVRAALRRPAEGSREPLLGSEDAEAAAGGKPASRRWQLAQAVGRYVWPDRAGLRLRLLGCFALVAAGRVINVAVPIAFKQTIDALSAAASSAAGGKGPPPSFRRVFLPWVAAYLALYLLQGGAGGGSTGLLSNLRALLWLPISQRAYARISLDVFGHLLQLDQGYHLQRSTGKVMRVLDRGTSSVQDVMSVIIFNVLPQLVDVVAACAFIALRLQLWTAVIVFVTETTYIPVTLLVTEYRGRHRKTLNALDTAKEGLVADLLLNVEAVQLFCNEGLELRQYGAAVQSYQDAEFVQAACVNALQMAQAACVFAGLASGLAICVRGIVDGRLTVGDAVMFIQLMNQLYAPLSQFGSFYRQLQKGFLDMEAMFQILDRRPAVCDAPAARPLAPGPGEVALEGVSFGYDPSHMVLRDVSFAARGGATLALVGPSGGGKSTILRLLLRLWDPVAGRVLLDGQDLRTLTLASARGALGVVPQDAALFNDSIAYNIRYGRPAASDAEVEAAARAAQLHDTIAGRFPHGYATLVGERGLRLSGGEKQRVAVARALLREPRVLILDEATSALDSITERAVQAALAALRRSCTVVVVAHRLSTVVDADAIVVLHGGQVAETGSHAELLAGGGLYSRLWAQQQHSRESWEPLPVESGGAEGEAGGGPAREEADDRDAGG